MKKTALLIASLGLLAGCYDDYTMDYDYTGAYFTYQYDLRTFVYGEDTQVGFTVCLGGTVHNDRDRKVDVEIKDNLLSTDLSIFDETGELGGFKAIDGLKFLATYNGESYDMTFDSNTGNWTFTTPDKPARGTRVSIRIAIDCTAGHTISRCVEYVVE